jgi:hypothetical protein
MGDRIRRPQNLNKVGDPTPDADIRGIDRQADSALNRIRQGSDRRTRLLGHILVDLISRRLTHPSAFSPSLRYNETKRVPSGVLAAKRHPTPAKMQSFGRLQPAHGTRPMYFDDLKACG